MSLLDIDVNSLRGALNACLDSLDCEKSKEIVNSLGGNSAWTGKAKDNLVTALETLTTTRFDDLKNKIESFYSVADSIESYQTLNSEIEQLNDDINYRRNKIYVENYKKEKNQSTITTLTNEINSLKTEISTKSEQMEAIESTLNNGTLFTSA